jgi:hypothetical protein
MNKGTSEKEKRTLRQSNITTGEKLANKTPKKTAFDLVRLENHFYSHYKPSLFFFLLFEVGVKEQKNK